VVGNANLTNAFGQSTALVTIVAASTWTLRWPAVGQLVALSALAAVALLSHVSTFALLGTMLFALACAYSWKGGSALRPQAWSILVALSIAVVVSVVSYRTFGQVYRRSDESGPPPRVKRHRSPFHPRHRPPCRGAPPKGQGVNIGRPMLFLAGIGSHDWVEPDGISCLAWRPGRDVFVFRQRGRCARCAGL
jgi:hypothetical protein